MAITKLSDIPNRTDLNPVPELSQIRLAGTTGEGGTARNVNVPVQELATQDDLYNHMLDRSAHLSLTDRMQFDRMVDLLKPVITPGTVTAPADAIPDEWFASYFARNAQPGMQVAPGNVFVSRVPYATKTASGAWQNTGSAISVTQYSPDDIKLLDNTGLQHKCSTDVTENPDDYVGKKWAFYWARCNYKRDTYGVKWITAVEGETVGLPNGTTAVFDPKKPTGSFGPAIWTFCVLDTAWGLNEDGTPGHQLWGIGDRPWDQINGLTAGGVSRKDWLIAHGVREVDYNLWSTAKWYDDSTNTWKPRSYIVDSAYCGTAEVDSTGHLVGISSKINEPVIGGGGDITRLKMGHNAINNILGNKGGGGTRAAALGIMFDIVKNATKDSQSIHYGMMSNNSNAIVAESNLLNPGYLFPVSGKGNFEVGCTVYLQTATDASTNTVYVRSTKNQIGRIRAIENREVMVITSDDPNVENPETEVQTKLCLVIDEDTVEPFFVRNTAALANALANEGTYACSYATPGIALAGETAVGGASGHGVIGKHDGYIAGTNGRHPYRVQGMEMACGVHQCAADSVVLKGTGSTSVTLPDGTTTVPTSSQYVYLYAPSNIIHRQSGSLQNFLDSGYVATGIGTTTGGYIFNGFVDTRYGMWRVTDTGASTTTGHADNSIAGANPAEYMSGGHLYNSAAGGSTFLDLSVAVYAQFWYNGARD